MERELWSGLAVFAEIAEAGSFAKAATRLGLSASALSHTMRSLEKKLGIRLLDRTTRSLAPTPAGDALLIQLRPAMTSVEAALGTLGMARDRPAGRVRVNAHRPAAVHVVLPKLAKLAADHPEVVVELVIDDGLVDIVAQRFDCGVRHEGALQQDMVSVRISDTMPLMFAAAPAYLAAHETPWVPEDLSRHRCLCYRHTSSGAVHRWTFQHEGEVFEREVPATFVTNDADVMRDAALAGLGVACLLKAQAKVYVDDGQLTEILPGWAPTLPPNYLYYPSRRQPSAAFRAFVRAMRWVA
jgi:DNA-binding transcriptional LysR family regulator